MNNNRKKWSLLLLSLTLALGLAACSKNTGNDSGSAETPSPTASVSPSASASDSPSASPSANSSPSASTGAAESASILPAGDAALPATRTFTLHLEGNEEKQTAKLAKGNGYALYVFDAFTFDAETGKLFMDVDKQYYVEITKLPSGFRADQLKKDAEKALSKLGKVRQEEKNPLIGDTTFLLLANNDKLTNEIILKEVAGTGYLLKVNMPHTEPSEGFGPHAFLSLSSIANQ